MQDKFITIPEGTRIIQTSKPPKEYLSKRRMNVKIVQQKLGWIYFFRGNNLWRVSQFLIPVLLFFAITAPPPAYASSRDITLCSPELQIKFHELKQLAEKENIEFILICGLRTQEEQNNLYKKGRTIPGKKVTWTLNSKHTQGKAFDIAILKDNGISWKGEDYFRIGELGESIGLIWGGGWKERDYVHFQLPE